ncbi:MAG: hypothetical protein ACRDHM_02985 [Actinomycetota bacterium]
MAAREERRLERKQRDADRAAGLIEAGTPIAPNEPDEFEVQPPGSVSEDEATSPESEQGETKPEEKQSEDKS